MFQLRPGVGGTRDVVIGDACPFASQIKIRALHEIDDLLFGPCRILPLTRVLSGFGFAGWCLELRILPFKGGDGGEELSEVGFDGVDELVDAFFVGLQSEVLPGAGDTFEEVDEPHFGVLGFGNSGGDGGRLEEVVDEEEQIATTRLEAVEEV